MILLKYIFNLTKGRFFIGHILLLDSGGSYLFLDFADLFTPILLKEDIFEQEDQKNKKILLEHHQVIHPKIKIQYYDL